ncbi:MAG: helix-turn-helix transcriptional regulator [Mariprofundaceae bacterium]
MMKGKDKKEPYGNIHSSEDIGKLIRLYRKKQSVTQAELAALFAVGVRFISNLENGKPTVELGKVLHVLKSLGLEVAVTPRSWEKQTPIIQNMCK